jgi:ribosomal protein S3
MGQKVIPISLRLNKNENWHSKWIVEKNEYSNLLHFDLEIRKYFQNIFNYKNFKLIKLNVVKISKNINIYVYVHDNQQSKNFKFFNKIVNQLILFYSYKDYSIKIFIKRIKLKELLFLKKNIGKIFHFIKKNNRINHNTRQMIYNFSYAFYTKNINMISYYIKQVLSRKKTHKKFIKNINNILVAFFKIFSNFIGYRLQFKGRLNGSKRKKKLIHQKGKIPLNTLKYDIKYHFNEFKTPSGICSIKFWVFFKKKKNVISK